MEYPEINGWSTDSVYTFENPRTSQVPTREYCQPEINEIIDIEEYNYETSTWNAASVDAVYFQPGCS